MSSIGSNHNSDECLRAIIKRFEPTDGKKDTRGTLVLILPTSDHIKAFSIRDGNPFYNNIARLAEKYKIVWVRAESINDVTETMQKVTKISHLYICGHGNEFGVELSVSMNKPMNESNSIVVSNISSASFPHLSERPHILIDSCSTGAIRKGGNIAEQISKSYPAAKCYAPNKDIQPSLSRVYFDSEGPILFQTDGISSNPVTQIFQHGKSITEESNNLLFSDGIGELMDITKEPNVGLIFFLLNHFYENFENRAELSLDPVPKRLSQSLSFFHDIFIPENKDRIGMNMKLLTDSNRGDNRVSERDILRAICTMISNPENLSNEDLTLLYDDQLLDHCQRIKQKLTTVPSWPTWQFNIKEPKIKSRVLTQIAFAASSELNYKLYLRGPKTIEQINLIKSTIELQDEFHRKTANNLVAMISNPNDLQNKFRLIERLNELPLILNEGLFSSYYRDLGIILNNSNNQGEIINKFMGSRYDEVSKEIKKHQ